MKIGIILFSETGNTYSVAKKLKENLKKHDVTIEKIEINRTSKDRSEFEITYNPIVENYDILIFGSFTEGFKLNPVMRKYLEDKQLKGKKVLLFVTHFFPYKWLGGTSAMKELKDIMKFKQAKVLATSVINWSSKKRTLETLDLINEFKQFID
jgi:flavodoxin